MSDEKTLNSDGAFCKSCGTVIKKDAEICPKCGVRQKNNLEAIFDKQENSSSKSRGIALLLSLLLGYLGIHRFYVGKIGTGILWLCTGGCFTIGWIIDNFMVLFGKFTDKDGKTLKNW